MRFKDYTEATAFIRALLIAKEAGKRELMGVKLDSLPQWQGKSKTSDTVQVAKLDGSEIEAVYLSYQEATDKQKKEATPAKLAGVKLERISGRLVDVRRCQDGTVQVLFTNGLRTSDGVAWRGPNIDKGILCALSIGEGLGETVDEVIARVPDEMIAKLKEMKAKGRRKTKPMTEPVKAKLVAAITELAQVNAKRPSIIDVPSVEPPKQQEGRSKLR